MKDRYLRAFELQFTRFLDEIIRVYPQEKELGIWSSALSLKQTIQPQQTRQELYEYFFTYIYEPYKDLIVMDDVQQAEVIWMERMKQGKVKDSVHSDYSEYFDRFNALFLYDTAPAIKEVLWKYMKSLGELIVLIQSS